MSAKNNGNSRSKDSSAQGRENKKVFSSINVTAKGYLAEITHKPSQSDNDDGMYFARLNLLMGKDGDKYDYQTVSVLAGGKAKQVVQKLFDSQSYDGDRAQHALSGVVFDVTIGNVVLGVYETDSSAGVDFKGVLTELAF